MALVGTTLLSEALFPATASAFNTSNLTTVSGELLVVIVGFNEFSGVTDPTADLTITNTGTALTFTQRAIEGTDYSFSQGIVVYTAPVTTGATIQLTLDCGARNVRRCMVHCESYSGYDTGSPVGTTGEDSDVTNGGSTYSFNLATNPASTSEVIAAVLQNAWTSTTHGTGWTELSDFGSSGNLGMQVQVRSGSTSTAVAWDATTGSTPLVGVAVEIKQASGGGGWTTITGGNVPVGVWDTSAWTTSAWKVWES
jgi:hypothetical protein